MKRSFHMIIAAAAVLALAGMGVLVDRFGYVEIRTNGADRAIDLIVPSPMLMGVPVAVRWQGHGGMQDRAVELRLVHGQGTTSLGSSALVSGLARITLPCALPVGESRMELVDVSTGSIVASAAVRMLPPGPDCVY